MPNPRRLLIAIVVVVVAAAAAPAVAARVFEVPAFPVAPGSEAVGLRAAVGTDGTMVLAWQEGGVVKAQLFSQAGGALAAPVAVASGAQQRLAADTRGGYVVAYTRDVAGRRRLFGQRLDAAGQTAGAEIAVDQLPEGDALLPEVLGLPSGFAFVWQQGEDCWLRRYDADGVALADAFAVGANQAALPLEAAALDDGGILVVWHDGSVHTFLGRTFNGDGSQRAGPTFLPSVSLDVQAVAATADGGFVALGVYLTSTLRAVRFNPAFNVVAERDVAALPAGDTPVGALARDAAGRWLVTFATARYDAGHTHLIGYLAPRALPLAADLSPLEASFALDDLAVPRVASALLPSGSFVSAWSTAGAPGAARGYAAVVSLCTPDVHVCGDGTLDPRCEECDDGIANSDTAPDACRTDCLAASCGDGVGDAGEACDDGDPSPCDGCDAACQPVGGLVCGDGGVVPGCSEQCDDGNTAAGDGCTAGCAFERIPGGGAAKTDCQSEWIVDNPANVPLLDAHGRPSRTQRCVDDDPRCDFDGGTPGRCTFRVRACAGNTDVAGCVPDALAAWDLAKPSAKQAARRPELAAIRAAFAAVPGTLVGTSTADLCSGDVEAVVPLRGSAPSYASGKVTLGATATTVDGVRDKDGLKLICLP